VASTWDALGQETATTLTMDGVARTLAYLYDVAGNRTRVTHPDAAWFGYQYDVLGRMNRLDSSGTTGLLTRTFNAYGLLATMARYSSAHDATLGYNPIGLLTSMGVTSGNELVDPATGTTRFLYDPGSGPGQADPLVSYAGSAITLVLQQ
jgi:hypothetical protein